MSINVSYSSSRIKTYTPCFRTTSLSWSPMSCLVARPIPIISHRKRSVVCMVKSQSICKKRCAFLVSPHRIRSALAHHDSVSVPKLLFSKAIISIIRDLLAPWWRLCREKNKALRYGVVYVPSLFEAETEIITDRSAFLKTKNHFRNSDADAVEPSLILPSPCRI